MTSRAGSSSRSAASDRRARSPRPCANCSSSQARNCQRRRSPRWLAGSRAPTRRRSVKRYPCRQRKPSAWSGLPLPPCDDTSRERTNNRRPLAEVLRDIVELSPLSAGRANPAHSHPRAAADAAASAYARAAACTAAKAARARAPRGTVAIERVRALQARVEEVLAAGLVALPVTRVFARSRATLCSPRAGRQRRSSAKTERGSAHDRVLTGIGVEAAAQQRAICRKGPAQRAGNGATWESDGHLECPIDDRMSSEVCRRGPGARTRAEAQSPVCDQAIDIAGC